MSGSADDERPSVRPSGMPTPSTPQSAADAEHRSTMRLLRLAHFTTTVQLILLLLPVVVFLVVFIGIVVVLM